MESKNNPEMANHFWRLFKVTSKNANNLLRLKIARKILRGIEGEGGVRRGQGRKGSPSQLQLGGPCTQVLREDQCKEDQKIRNHP